MKYYIDIDNTICYTIDSDYINSIPIFERINKINKLKEENNYIVYWTARGSKSNIDYSELTKKQLNEWNVKYDEILFNKPDYDIYIDDKSFNVNTYWELENKNNIVRKGWGYENIFVNNDEYCGKILHFYKERSCSMHYHLLKKETWYINFGKIILRFIDTYDGKLIEKILYKGDVYTNERGSPHQVEALEETEIFEVSTKHYDSDSYRIYKGD